MKIILKIPKIHLTLAIISISYFLLFVLPNSTASENRQMVAVFEPDESVPLRYVFDMIKPADTVKQALINFAFYDYYFYGYPHFVLSALSLLPIKILGSLDNTALVMVTLRQIVSVLPMIIAILMLVHLQTLFRTYKAIILTVLLFCVPGVVSNNFWWHPDSLAILFAVLAIFFLNRDNLHFGPDFFLAAVMCGFSAGAKGIGFYFFLTIFVYLLLGFLEKKIPVGKLLLLGIGFLVSMGAAYLFANPILIYKGVREQYFSVMREQARLLSSGYEVYYDKGFSAALPVITNYYGSILFILAGVISCAAGILKDKNRLLNIIILTWMFPISIQVLWITHFKFQYWLPVALPLFSSMVIFLPEKIILPKMPRGTSWSKMIQVVPQTAIALLIVIQLGIFINSDIAQFAHHLNRAKESDSIKFHELAFNALDPLPDQEMLVYHDVRMYVPPTKYWKTRARFKILDYGYIQSQGFDVLLLMQQRLYDYLNPNIQGINPTELEQSKIFYRDADVGTIEGYQLIFRNQFGLVYVKSELYDQYFLHK